MKKLALFLAVVLLLSCFAGCDQTPVANTELPTVPPTEPSTEPSTEPPTEPPTEPEKLFITNDEVDLRQMVVDYMLAMANIKWTAGLTIDYSFSSKSLVYESGKTYLGMVYNATYTGYEKFLSILDENNNHIGTDTNWQTSPGNSCSTTIEHAWQLVSPTVEYGSCYNMLPYYESNGVVAIGDIDWSLYDGEDTNSVFKNTERKVLLEAYALMQPGDALVRFINNAGHALMVTKAPEVVRNPDGSVNLVNSYLYLTEQNNLINNTREYPSSWKVNMKVSFSQVLMDKYLPVTVAELRDGASPIPTFQVTEAPKAEDLAGGTVAGTVESNYCFNTVRIEIRSGDQVVASAQDHTYKRSFDLGSLSEALNIAQLPAGQYTLAVIAEVGLATKTLVEVNFSK